MDALAGGQANLRSCRNGVGAPVGVDGNIAFIIHFLIGQAVIHPNEHISAAPVDDVLGFIPVEMVGRILPFLQIQQLFGVYLGIFFRHLAIAVADGNQGKTNLVKVAQAVIRDVPAQHTLPHLVIVVTDILPLLRCKMAEGRQIAAVFGTHRFQFFQCLVDFRTFHGNAPFQIL